MLDRWYIDNIDIYKKYNVGLVKDGFLDLFAFASLRTPYSNNWHEQNGIEVDLENPILDNKIANITFASVTQDNLLVDEFLSDLTKEGCRELYIKSIGRTFKLRPVLENNRQVYKNLQMLTLQFADDFPRGQLYSEYKVWGTEANEVVASENMLYSILVDGESILIEPKGHGFTLPKSDYKLDNLRFDEYGIVVEKGKAEVYKIPNLKKNLERKISNKDSVEYDVNFVRYEAKDVNLECALYCDTIDKFWSNYMAFFSDLIKPNERQLYVDYANDTYPCFYKNMKPTFFFRGRDYVLLKFEITLTFTKFRPLKTVLVWGTENREVVVTEDNINTIIYE